MSTAGLGALVIVTALILTVPALRGGTSLDGHQVQSGRNNIQVGEGGCIQNGGSGNVCNAAIPTREPTAESLNVNPTWPLFRNCDGATEVAMLPGGPSPHNISADRDLMIKAGGAAYEFGVLTLDLTVTDSSTIEIDSVHPVFFASEPTVKPIWVFAPEGGCGDTYERQFVLDLDHRTLVDKGVQGPSELLQPGDIKPAAGEPGKPFHVSSTDPAQITIEANGCRGLYEWGVQIIYTVGGKTYTKNIGTREQPFRVVGPDSQAPVYTQTADNAPLSKIDMAVGSLQCRT